MLHWFETMFTEANLVGYYCCVTESDLPTIGTLARTISDFFKTPFGVNLLANIFIGANLILLAVSIRVAGKGNYGWIPLLFIVFGLFYFAADLTFSTTAWGISDWVNGTTTTVYSEYGRTIYGIMLHLILWVCYFAFLI